MQQFVLLLHQRPVTDPDAFSPEEIQAVIQDYVAWADAMTAKDLYAGGHKLTPEGGKSLVLEGERLDVTDGPYVETKEIIGGLFVIKARDYDHATELVADCPHLKYGGRIELRQVHDYGCE